MSLIKVGLEATREDLRKDLLAHPCRYFFILITDSRTALCLCTCDGSGENLKSHVIDGLRPDYEGNLISIFEEELRVAANRDGHVVLSGEDKMCSITPEIAEKIRILPDFVDWMISTVLTKGRNIVVYPGSWG